MKSIPFIAITVLLAGCGDDYTTPTATKGTNTAPMENSRTDQPSGPVNVDNSGVNKRDNNDSSLTPGDQGGSESDRSITAAIRKAVVAEKDFSIKAQNVKIITVESRVTLRGPVDLPYERDRIGELANGVTGVQAVDNQVEVVQPK